MEKGIVGFPLMADTHRAPVWPRGIVGSITHTDGFCAAAVGRSEAYAGVGIDAEVNRRAARDLWSTLFTAWEIGVLERIPYDQQESVATVMFSAKESFYKAQYSFTKQWLDFTATEVSIEADRWHLRVVDSSREWRRIEQHSTGQFVILDRRIVLTAIAIDTL